MNLVIYPANSQGLARASHLRQESGEGRSLERKGPSRTSQLALDVSHRMQKSRIPNARQTDTTRPKQTITRDPHPDSLVSLTLTPARSMGPDGL